MSVRPDPPYAGQILAVPASFASKLTLRQMTPDARNRREINMKDEERVCVKEQIEEQGLNLRRS